MTRRLVSAAGPSTLSDVGGRGEIDPRRGRARAHPPALSSGLFFLFFFLFRRWKWRRGGELAATHGRGPSGRQAVGATSPTRRGAGQKKPRSWEVFARRRTNGGGLRS